MNVILSPAELEELRIDEFLRDYYRAASQCTYVQFVDISRDIAAAALAFQDERNVIDLYRLAPFAVVKLTDEAIAVQMDMARRHRKGFETKWVYAHESPLVTFRDGILSDMSKVSDSFLGSDTIEIDPDVEGEVGCYVEPREDGRGGIPHVDFRPIFFNWSVGGLPTWAVKGQEVLDMSSEHQILLKKAMSSGTWVAIENDEARKADMSACQQLMAKGIAQPMREGQLHFMMGDVDQWPRWKSKRMAEYFTELRQKMHPSIKTEVGTGIPHWGSPVPPTGVPRGFGGIVTNIR